MHGVRTGRTLQHFATQLVSLLERSGLTAKEAAERSKMTESRFVALLCTNYYAFATLKLDDLTRLGLTFDVAISVKMISRNSESIPVVVVKTFEEEKDDVTFAAESA